MTEVTRISRIFVLLAWLSTVHAYWLFSGGMTTQERMDPIVNPGQVSSHVHSFFGGSNLRMTTDTALLRQSECTSMSIKQDKSAYWVPSLYFQRNDGSFASVRGDTVLYYLFPDRPGSVKAFPAGFKMITGDPMLRTYTPTSAQRAITFLCLDFNGQSVTFDELPHQRCPSGIRTQANFPSCWDGKNLDSPDHKSHVAFPSGGPDSGTCNDPAYPVQLPRIFSEVYWSTPDFDNIRDQAMVPEQPFVFSYGDRTGYGYHADFINGWEAGVLERAVDECNCNIYGDPTCCAQRGIFDLQPGGNCKIGQTVSEQTTGTIPKLPGNNPVQEEGTRATMYTDVTSSQPLTTSSTPTIAITSSSTTSPASTPTSTSAIYAPSVVTSTSTSTSTSTIVASVSSTTSTSSTAAQTTVSTTSISPSSTSAPPVQPTTTSTTTSTTVATPTTTQTSTPLSSSPSSPTTTRPAATAAPPTYTIRPPSFPGQGYGNGGYYGNNNAHNNFRNGLGNNNGNNNHNGSGRPNRGSSRGPSHHRNRGKRATPLERAEAVAPEVINPSLPASTAYPLRHDHRSGARNAVAF